jgi:hypothetical protein
LGKEEGIEPLPWWRRLGDGNQERIRLLMAPVVKRIKRGREGGKTESRERGKRGKTCCDSENYEYGTGSVAILVELGSIDLGEENFHMGSTWK